MKVNYGQLGTEAEIVLIRLSREAEGQPAGTLSNVYLPEPVSFYGLGDLLLELDAIYRYLRFPCQDRDIRYFSSRRQLQANRPPVPLDALQYERHWELETTMQEPCDFVVQVVYRQNDSWQGFLTWTGRNLRVPFTSALQLLRLLAEAMGCDGKVQVLDGRRDAELVAGQNRRREAARRRRVPEPAPQEEGADG
ncbi:hypothetical protein [uncultured Anaerotruncus sp.]|uniref:hypothetical protein n=1 Tax=uncultured Anaerotruncus sp. TaxID=905011 RepID=UPI00280A6E35|nr:hypothetical protein [uncultured Anaerotruncus sp.]